MQQAGVIVDAPVVEAIGDQPGQIRTFSDISALAGATVQQKAVRLGTLETPLLALLKHWSKPAVVAGALLICILFSSERATRADWALALVAIVFSRQVFSPLQMLSDTSEHRAQRKLLLFFL